MKKCITAVLICSFLLSMFSLPAFSADEELQVYFYEDFQTGYEDGETNITSFDSGKMQRSLVNGEYVLKMKTSTEGYEAINFSKTLTIPEKPRVILEYKLSGNLYGGSNAVGFNASYGVPTCFVNNAGVRADSYNAPENIAPASLANGTVITIVYDNENPSRDIYVDGNFAGTFDMSNFTHGRTYCDTGELKLFFYNHIHARSKLNYHYVKVFEAPKDYDRETFNSRLYKNIGKPEETMAQPQTQDPERYYSMLEALGLYIEADAGEYNGDVPMTRLQFASILCNAVKVGAKSNPVGIYKDIARRHFMAGKLETLYDLGIMKGIGEEAFGPDENITLEQAVTALIRALGYQELADYRSGYATGFFSIAREIGLLKGVSVSGDELSSRDVTRLFYNFLNSEIFEVVGVNRDSYVMQNVEGNTVLKVYHGLVGIRDILTANSITALTDSAGMGEGRVRIGEIALQYGQNDLERYLGYDIEVYYDVETETIQYWMLTDKNRVLQIEAEQFAGYEDGKLHYEKNEKLLAEKLPANADIIYNNKATSFSSSIFDNLKMGNLVLIDNNGDGKCEVAVVSSYMNRIVESKSADSQLIKFRNGKGAVSLKNDYEDYLLLSASGKKLTFDQIGQDNVLSLMESADRTYAVIYVSSGSIVGECSEIYSEGNRTILTIGGSAVPADANFLAENPSLSVGINGEFFTDVFGRIAYYTGIAQRGDGIAYLMGVMEQDSLNDAMKLKMYTEYNQLAVFETREKIILDGRTVPARELLGYDVLYDENNLFQNQLVLYQLNSEGKVTSIDTRLYDGEVEDENNTLYFINTGSYKYDNIDNSFGNDIYLNSSCKVFMVPETDQAGARAERFSCSSPSSSFINEANYDITTYRRSGNTFGVDAIVAVESKGNANFNSYYHAMLISRLTQVYDETEEEIIYKLYYYHEGQEQTVMVKDESLIAEIAPGDVVVLNKNSREELTAIKPLFHLSRPDAITPAARGGIHRAVYGTVYEIKDDLMQFTPSDPTAAAETELHRIPAYIYIFDTRTQQVKLGYTGDVVDYVTDSGNCSRVVFYETKGYDYDLIIYK